MDKKPWFRWQHPKHQKYSAPSVVPALQWWQPGKTGTAHGWRDRPGAPRRSHFLKKQVNHLKYFFLGLSFCLRCPCKTIAFHRQIKDLYALDKQGEVYVLTMWREGVKEGDRIVLDEGEFLVRWVEYYLDPPDMFIAEIEICA